MRTLVILLALAACRSKGPEKPVPTDSHIVATDPAPARPADSVVHSTDTLAVDASILRACGITADASWNPRFEFDRAELSASDRALLEKLATCLTTGTLAHRSVALVGRADPRGTDEYNMGLGSQRAAAVIGYLARLGVGRDQLLVSTRGALDATGADEDGWAVDRRVDITMP